MAKENIDFIPYEEVIPRLRQLMEKEGWRYFLDEKKQQLSFEDDDGERMAEIRFPLSFPRLEDGESLEAYLNRVPEKPIPYVMFLMQSGNCALGYFSEGEVVHHKVIRKYMVRKKRGKSQLTYLKKKGKSRAGSRVRLADSFEFFEETNAKLNEYLKLPTEKILYSCPTTLWPFVFQTKEELPFEKKDARLQKVPRDVQTPTFEELKKVNKFCQFGRVTMFGEI